MKNPVASVNATSAAITVITREAVTVSPSSSVIEYVNVYVPAVVTSTVPETVILDVMSPSSSSVAVTPVASLNVASMLILASVTPASTGALFSSTGGSSSGLQAANVKVSPKAARIINNFFKICSPLVSFL